ncbi:DUF5825 family protein [Nocardia terpenica]|uniref:DUF5825 family protein n=1 Tax=Nocardia terpenica TaxID=455432 RepID=UPI0012E7CCC6|nr:DUF5825 family protein [Nocardia terpenica]NQE89345.1 hypothetical protein [Nocardia terpenica]
MHANMHHPDEFLAFVADLRDMTARGESVRWTCAADADTVAPLQHLAPPLWLKPGVEPTVWRARHRPCQFYFRRGPGFVIIHDERSGSAVETLLDDPEHLVLFERLHHPGALRPGSATSALRAAGLLFELGDKGVVLPYRLSRLALPTKLL